MGKNTKKWLIGTGIVAAGAAAATAGIRAISHYDDNFAPVRMTYENYAACTSEKHLLIVPSADHAMSYCVEQDRYEKAAKDFWKTHDV